MKRPHVGLTRAQVNRGLQIIRGSRTKEAFRRAVASESVLLDPMFQLAASRALASSAYSRRLDHFFTVLHERVQSEAGRLAAELQTPESRPVSQPDILAPPFLRAILDALGDRLPPPRRAPIRLDNAGAVRRALHRLGIEVDLPRGERRRDKFCLLVVECPGCERRRLIANAYEVQAGSQVAHRVESAALCPRCGCAVCVPIFVWATERGGPTAALDAAGQLVIVATDKYVYAPAFGPVRAREHERVIEHFGRRRLQGKQHLGQFYISFAYSDRESVQLVEYLQRSDLPFSMHAFASDVAWKLRTEVFTVAGVETEIRKKSVRLSSSWPLPPPVDLPFEEPFLTLAYALIGEELGRRRRPPWSDRVQLAGQSARMYLAMGMPALAEIAVRRAEASLRAGPRGPLRDVLGYDLKQQRADMLVQRGDHAGALALRRLPVPAALRRGTLPARVAEARREAAIALDLLRISRIVDAAGAFPRAIAQLEELQEELAERQEKALASPHLPGVEHSLSGALANFATLLVECADELELTWMWWLLEEERAPLPDEKRRRLLARRQVILSRIPGATSVRRSRLRSARRVLEMLQNRDPDAGEPWFQLRMAAYRMRFRALELSEGLGSWVFAARQALRSADDFALEGGEGHAEDLLLRAVGHARRGLDNATLRDASLALARVQVRKRDGGRALVFVRAAARAETRRVLGQGRHGSVHQLAEIGALALSCTEVGADAAGAIAVAEGTKAVALARSMAHPVNGGTGDSVLDDPKYLWWCDASRCDIENGVDLAGLIDRSGAAVFAGFLVHGGRVWSYGISKGQAVASWRTAPPRPRLMRRGRLDSAATALVAELIVAPVGELLSGVVPGERVIFSVAPELAWIPVAALPFEGKPLGAAAAICVIPGLGALANVLDRAPGKLAVLAIGDPAPTGLDPLDDAATEARTIAKRFRKLGCRAAALVRRAATFAAVRRRAPWASVLHFACHAGAPAGAPNGLPVLVLARGKGESGEVSDKRVLRELGLRDGAFVNLAACRSAAHEDAVGPGVRGLVPAFLAAGASGVLASLWPIDDGLALQFSTEFYAALLRGHGPAAALSTAQAAFRSGRFGRSASRAEAWAGYVLFGVR